VTSLKKKNVSGLSNKNSRILLLVKKNDPCHRFLPFSVLIFLSSKEKKKHKLSPPNPSRSFMASDRYRRVISFFSSDNLRSSSLKTVGLIGLFSDLGTSPSTTAPEFFSVGMNFHDIPHIILVLFRVMKLILSFLLSVIVKKKLMGLLIC
jgi:hypothetical protein